MEKLNSTHFNDSRTFADYVKIVEIVKTVENTEILSNIPGR